MSAQRDLPPPYEQTWTADGYEAHARFVSDLGEEILSWLNPKPGEHILDLGCGDGALTARIAERGARVVGVDSSKELQLPSPPGSSPGS